MPLLQMVTSAYVQFGILFRHRLFLALQYFCVIPQNDSCKVESKPLVCFCVMESALANHDLDLHVNLHTDLPRMCACLMHTLT